MVGGVTLGLFSLGMFVPWANARGAMLGAVTGLALVLWIGLGAQIESLNGNIRLESKPLSTKGCPSINGTMKIFEGGDENEPAEESDVFALYRVRHRFDLIYLFIFLFK